DRAGRVTAMRVLILGGTLFIGRRIALELLARGDDVMVAHRGQTEPAELSGCAHVHVARTALAGVADQLRAWRPDAVIDTRAMTAADASAVLPHLPDAHLVLLSSMEYRSVASGQVFNVGDLTTGTVRDWALAILAPAGSSASLVTVPEDLVAPDLEDTRSIAKHFLVDSRKAATLLGWCPSDPA